MAKYFQGRFRPKNPQKYMGDPTKIEYRSSWEFACMRRLDESDKIIGWSSEETIIPYVSPIDNKVHRYFVDLRVVVRNPDNTVSEYLIEIKPSVQTKPPMLQEGKKPTKSYIKAVQAWGVNDAKWKAAREWCAKRGIKFQVMTEKELFGH